jgi:hypothetical protein
MTPAPSHSSYTEGSNERPRYYPRQIITADDLTLDQEYFREKLRRHNRLIHGWGIICGATLDYSTKPWIVIVKSGDILGPWGDAITISRDVCFDVRTSCVEPAAMADDPCRDKWQPPPIAMPAGPVSTYVAVKYVELRARPVRVAAAGCGCVDNQCESSRWRDSYQLCTLETLPASHMGTPQSGDLTTAPPPCSPAPMEPWVVLGSVAVDKAGAITQIGYKGFRRQLMSFPESSWWTPNDPVTNPKK